MRPIGLARIDAFTDERVDAAQTDVAKYHTCATFHHNRFDLRAFGKMKRGLSIIKAGQDRDVAPRGCNFCHVGISQPIWGGQTIPSYC